MDWFNRSANAKHCPRYSEYYIAKFDERPLTKVAAAAATTVSSG
jgi:hypothetical protein